MISNDSEWTRLELSFFSCSGLSDSYARDASQIYLIRTTLNV